MSENIEAKNDKNFCPKRILDALNKSILNDDNGKPGDVTLKDYLIAYEEIVKFFDYLGTIFHFVVSDVKEKLTILNGYVEKHPEEYRTIHKTLSYEKENKIHINNKSNASRHILRLHRALLFIYKFLEKLYHSDHKTKSSTICWDVYDATLAKHHPWLIRKAASLGMMTLPSHEVLVQYMCHSPDDHKQFPVFIASVELVYTITQSAYEKYQFLDLP